MATWKQLISRSLIEIGVLEGGEIAESHLLNEGLNLVQEMLDQWALEGLLSTGVLTYEYTFGPNPTRELTIGPTANNVQADIVTQNVPYTIIHLQYRGAGSDAYPIRPVSVNAWLDSQVDDDTATSESPSVYWYEPDHPHGKLALDRRPSPGDRLTLTTEKYIIPDNIRLNDEINLLRGYQKAIRLNLAVEMASSNGIKGGQLSPVTLRNASEAKKEVKKLNIQRHGQAKLDRAALSSGRTYSGNTGSGLVTGFNSY